MTTIQVTKDLEELLEVARQENPKLSDAEILKHALSELHYRRELEERRAWMASLPELELSAAERAELTEALQEADVAIRRGEAKAMTVEEIMAEALSE